MEFKIPGIGSPAEVPKTASTYTSPTLAHTLTPLLPQGHNALSRIHSVAGTVQAHYLFIFSLDGSSMVLYRTETAFLLWSDESNFSQMKLL